MNRPKPQRLIEPLPLDSRRWRTLKAHFDNAAKDGDEVPAVTKLLPRWERAIGAGSRSRLSVNARLTCIPS
ncbi:MAG: hypothetical protein Q8L48_26970 [Archangium sp.]|nr:hypothetical protein [Archangium sp.]